MGDTGPAPEHASVTAARWALGGATAALVALTSGATALLVVTSTTGVALPLEDSHPLPGTRAEGFGGSADVLLLPGGSQAAGGTRADRADTGSDDPLLVLRRPGSRAATTRTGPARGASDGMPAPAPTVLTPPADSAVSDVRVLPGVEDRPEPEDERPREEDPSNESPSNESPSNESAERPSDPGPAPGRTTPPAQEEREDEGKGNGKGKAEDDEEHEGRENRDGSERTATATAPARPAADDRSGDDEDKDEKDKDEKDKDEKDKDEKDKDEKKEKDGEGNGRRPAGAGPPGGR